MAGYSKCAIVWAERGGKWVEEVKLPHDDKIVYDVAWAPGMGRSYHLIATVDRTRKFKVIFYFCSTLCPSMPNIYLLLSHHRRFSS